MEWVSVEDRFPEKSGDYIASDGDTVAELHFETRGRLRLWLEPSGTPSEPIDDITHWMPLPKPPEDK